MTDWQDISTAPKDGTRVIMWGPGWDGPQTHQWATPARAREEMKYWTDPPTHWVALPEPPK